MEKEFWFFKDARRIRVSLSLPLSPISPLDP